MSKHWFSKRIPDAKTLREHKYIRIFGPLLHQPKLWQLRRRSVARAMTVGLFCACLPIPFQMVVAAALAIIYRANLPISVTLVWTSNPITIGPLMYCCYKVGAWLLNKPPHPMHFKLSWAWLSASLGHVAVPLLLGCLLVGLITGMTAQLITRFLWRRKILHAWRGRH